MEKNPDMESFEDFIKQQSDDFRMYPTKRVWYSLYNNLHPGRKWPSISMCIVLLTTLFLIGFLNTNNNHSNIAAINTTSTEIVANNADKDQILSIQNIGMPEATNPGNTLTAKQPGSNGSPITAITNGRKSKVADLPAEQKQGKTSYPINNLKSNSGETIISESINIDALTATADLAIENQTGITASPSEKALTLIGTPANEADLTKDPNAAATNNTAATGSNIDDLQKILASSIEFTTSGGTKASTAGGETISEALLNKTTIAETEQPATVNVVTNLTDKSWIENYALYNKPSPKKWKGKLAWQAYFTPSVSYRKLFNNAAGKNIGNLATGMLGSNDATLSNEVTQSASIGLEAGVGLQYPVLKGIKIKAGLQLNYTRYNIAAFENSHPSITSLEMLSEINGKPYELYKTTAYSNNAGLTPATLHSQTFQLSLPVGADIKLAGNDLFEWYAGAAIQPTFVFAASSFLVSTDRRNYVKDNSMLNHFNMNAAFETYISFKSAGGLTWQIGPQLRKQLYSTSTKFYTVEERLMGYGLKVGFVKKL